MYQQHCDQANALHVEFVCTLALLLGGVWRGLAARWKRGTRQKHPPRGGDNRKFDRKENFASFALRAGGSKSTAERERATL